MGSTADGPLASPLVSSPFRNSEGTTSSPIQELAGDTSKLRSEARRGHFEAITTIAEGSVSVENRWVFEQDDDQQWRWVHLWGDAQQQQQSAESFQQPMDCVLDAVRHVVMRRKAMSEAE